MSNFSDEAVINSYLELRNMQEYTDAIIVDGVPDSCSHLLGEQLLKTSKLVILETECDDLYCFTKSPNNNVDSLCDSMKINEDISGNQYCSYKMDASLVECYKLLVTASKLINDIVSP